MNFFAIVRMALYAAAAWASASGFVTFDEATGLIDVQPFTIDNAITGIASVVAMVALWFGWGKK